LHFAKSTSTLQANLGNVPILEILLFTDELPMQSDQLASACSPRYT